ncbi:hypothetical protein Q7O_003692 [Pectobacterium carotovorum subsp. carotovorum PCCS1]|nr:hypothetical protein [Pectobacterium carotovorum subsp. carotovorum PCCS1]
MVKCLIKVIFCNEPRYLIMNKAFRGEHQDYLLLSEPP